MDQDDCSYIRTEKKIRRYSFFWIQEFRGFFIIDEKNISDENLR